MAVRYYEISFDDKADRMRNVSFDVAIVGAGSAGLAARSAAVAAGARTVIIEAGEGGTTCARCGCMPSKLLLRAAAAARAIGQAKEFGVSARASAHVNGRAVFRRVRRERDHFVKAVLDDVAKIPASGKLHGHARFVGIDKLAVDDRILVKAKSIIIAGGAKPAVPKELAGLEDRTLTHETVFELKDLPTSIAIIGAGPLGIEFAVAFARLGVRTAVFDVDKTIGGIEDEDVQEAAVSDFAKEFSLHLGVSFEARRRPKGVNIRWHGSGRTGSSTFEYVLAASGRPPHLDNLDLKITGLELNEENIPVFDSDTMQCGDSSVFMAGDVDNDRPVLHEASRQGEVAGRNAARFPKVLADPAGPPFAIVFTDPDIAKIGVSLKDLEDDGVEGKSDDNGRARVDGSNVGMTKIYARRSDGVIAGAEMFGLDVEHLAHLLAWAVQLKMKVKDILQLPFYHPTVEEGLRMALRDLMGKLD